ncbi:MAG: RsmB/NOP family class I SAM-dependent RNA methyltransferase [Theionarchaea archaeon]|nr:RsmB/NOP family class I SAM-dependent RNA methyltransferase [Theionarchaea archaeon]MBU7000588.1 RsmB/NOP family class I SAM-dependent RNA methyltransferase [Theionarchaea archaeon]MBU7020490.1 RsmB/NOP family class I SAM-dependent RNA methyltransferase [Theionarchaea archaeon]MBU7034468.1 RsmB/NOP family class I SAM-dependent RNA methyltransferase [Theionarchaea archaeon]MBU7039783.1 RsmB/NOP family class I SAM-dependent RNA methyltransferase [Theionarchaea archaeon]
MIRKLAKEYGYNQATLERYYRLFGKDIELLLEANEAEPPTYIRANTLKISLFELEQRLLKRGIRLREVEQGFLIEDAPFSVSSTPEYLLGYFYIQGIAEMQIAPLLHAEGVVIDMCAAPGGKTTHLAQLMRDTGVILALDVNREKIKALKANIQRMGVTNTIVYAVSALDFSYRCSRILLDAPCTGSGIIRKDPTRKYSRDSTDIAFCSRLQKDLLRKGVDNLIEEGVLLYSTCSLEPEENELIIDWALRELPVVVEPLEFTVNGVSAVEGITCPFGSTLHRDIRRCRRILPHIHDSNGMFVARLRKVQ